MTHMVPGYVIIIPFHDVTNQQQQPLQNLLIIRPIPAVINPPITVVIICSISIFQNISHLSTTISLPTNQNPIEDLETNQNLVVDQQPNTPPSNPKHPNFQYYDKKKRYYFVKHNNKQKVSPISNSGPSGSWYCRYQPISTLYSDYDNFIFN